MQPQVTQPHFSLCISYCSEVKHQCTHLNQQESSGLFCLEGLLSSDAITGFKVYSPNAAAHTVSGCEYTYKYHLPQAVSLLSLQPGPYQEQNHQSSLLRQHTEQV